MLEKAFQDFPKGSGARDAVDVLRVDILSIGEKKIRTDGGAIGETPFVDLVNRWYKSELFSKATAWYQRQINRPPFDIL